MNLQYGEDPNRVLSSLHENDGSTDGTNILCLDLINMKLILINKLKSMFDCNLFFEMFKSTSFLSLLVFIELSGILKKLSLEKYQPIFEEQEVIVFELQTL